MFTKYKQRNCSISEWNWAVPAVPVYSVSLTLWPLYVSRMCSSPEQEQQWMWPSSVPTRKISASWKKGKSSLGWMNLSLVQKSSRAGGVQSQCRAREQLLWLVCKGGQHVAHLLGVFSKNAQHAGVWLLKILDIQQSHVENAGILGVLSGGRTQLDEEKLSWVLEVLNKFSQPSSIHRGELPWGLPKEMWVTGLVSPFHPFGVNLRIRKQFISKLICFKESLASSH